MILRNSETCIENLDSFDRDKYASVLASSPIMQDMREKGKEIFPSFPSLQRDLWAGLYKYSTELKKQTPPELRVNQEILKHVYSIPEFQGLREITRLDNLASALGILSVEEKVQRVIGSCLSRNKEKASSLNQAVDKAKNSKLKEEILKKRLDELMKQFQNSTDKNQQSPPHDENLPGPSYQEQQNQGQPNQGQKPQDMNQQGQNPQEFPGEQGMPNQQLQQSIEQLQRALAEQQNISQQATQEAETIAFQMTSEVGQLLENNKEQLSASVGNATKETLDDIKNIRLLTQQGGSGYDNSSGQDSDSDVAASLEIAKQLKYNPQIKKVIKLAGKMKKIAFSKKKEKVLSMARQQVETGNNIERLIPNELLLFNTPDTHQYFLKRYSESQCLQYSEKAKDKAGKGPVVCCIDVSGSMQDYLNTERKSEWAKGVAFALYSIAMRDKRAFYLIEFDSNVSENFQIKKKETQKILRLLTPQHYGGTNFFKPLRAALKIITDECKFKKADIIFITDGSCSLSSEAIEEVTKQKKKTKTSIFSVQLDKSESSNTLEMFSELVIRYDGSDEFTKIFEI